MTSSRTAGGAPAPVLSLSPVTLTVPGRAVPLQVRVSAPTTGDGLPVLLLSHGQGFSRHLSSLRGYAPLADHYAAHGFVVLQATHLSSLSLDVPPVPDGPMHWRSRATDLTHVLDQLDAVELALPSLLGRVDRRRVAVVGHSMGGHTASLLLGARATDPVSGQVVDLTEPRISTGVLLAAPGRGGDAVTGTVAQHYGFLATTDFSQMRAPVLVIAGDRDTSEHLTVAGADWHADPYHLAPGSKALLTLFGGEHSLGGVSGYDVAETTDDSPERVAAVQRLSTAYLRTALHLDAGAWPQALEELDGDPAPTGRVETKDGPVATAA